MKFSRASIFWMLLEKGTGKNNFWLKSSYANDSFIVKQVKIAVTKPLLHFS